ncbi:hypothetical protein LO749_20895 [Paracoccus denitrificans]|uniref:hypothetical protein n=1 Tax=Paracoccus denitrificans TaxID=266 RepID=UPI001E3CD64E|nr:hypothetical protein [Paracoccus denitrificans]UFS66953.1 hypothetical protein LO749_20895 [Paracoccus denitrificans]
MNGTGSTLTTPQTSSTSPPEAYDADEHAEHLKNTYGLPGVEQPVPMSEEAVRAFLMWEEPEGIKEVTPEESYMRSRWSTFFRQVVEHVPSGTFWEISWSRGSTEYQDNGIEDMSFRQVWPREVKVVQYHGEPPE